MRAVRPRCRRHRIGRVKRTQPGTGAAGCGSQKLAAKSLVPGRKRNCRRERRPWARCGRLAIRRARRRILQIQMEALLERPIIWARPGFGGEQSGRESMPAVAEIFQRLLERRKAGARPGLIVGCVDWRVCEGRHKACPYRKLLGPPRTAVVSGQWSVVSSQWSVVSGQ